MTSLHRNRDFVRLWTGQAVSAVGSSVATIAYPLIALLVTGSAARAGVIGAVGAAAMVTASIPAGLLADRLPIRALMVTCCATQAAITASIGIAALTHRLTYAHLLIATVLTTAAGPVFHAADTIAVRHAVAPDQLAAAMAQGEARGHLARLTGTPLGGLLYTMSAALPILADAASYAVCALLVAGVRAPGRRTEKNERVLHQLTAGLRHIWAAPALRTTLVCSAGINVPFAGLSLAVVAARRGAGAAPLGVVFGLGAVGGLLGAWLSTPLLRRTSPATVIVGFGWFAAAAFAALGLVPSVYADGILIGLLWCAAAPANGVLYAAMIAPTPTHIQGRVISAAVTFLGISTPLGPLFGGALIERYGPAVAFAVFGAIIAASTAVLHRSRGALDLPRMSAATPGRRTSTNRPPDALPTAGSTPRRR